MVKQSPLGKKSGGKRNVSRTHGAGHERARKKRTKAPGTKREKGLAGAREKKKKNDNEKNRGKTLRGGGGCFVSG